MRQRSFAIVNSVRIWTGIGILVVLAIMRALPCQAVEPDRQVSQPTSLPIIAPQSNRSIEAATLLELPAMVVSTSETNDGQVVDSYLQFLSQWTRVMARGETQLDAMTHCNPEQDNCPAGTLPWKKILEEAKDLSFLEQLKSVNAYFNRWSYRLDIDAYGVNDYWASPQEFLQNSGDCEDYSIIKYFALKQLGVPVDQMSIVLLIDAIRDNQHAVLVVRNGHNSYLLDNLSDLLLPQEKYTHYLPLYSINEHYRLTYATNRKHN